MRNCLVIATMNARFLLVVLSSVFFGSLPANGYAAVASFDDVTKWSSEQTSLQSGQHSLDGSGSIGMPLRGYTRIRSAPFGVEGELSASWALTMRIPSTQPGWVGEAELVVRVPSAELWWEVVGRVPLAELPRDAFSTVSFPEFSAAVQQQLAVAEFAYDPAGRQLEVIYPDATRTQTQYDALGRRTRVTDQAGYSTQYQYDAVGNLTAVIDALGQVTRYAYDEQLSFNFEVQFQAML